MAGGGFTIGDWCWFIRQASPCRVIERQDVWGEGDLLWVRYDGRRAALVFRAPEGDTRQVDLFLCGETEPIRSTVVPVP